MLMELNFGMFLRSELKNIGNDPHGRYGRINVGIPHHEFLQDIILDGPGSVLPSDSLLFGSNNIKCQDRKYRTVHGHGNRHFIQGDLVKQDLHVEDGIDGNTGFPDIANHPL